MGESSLSQKELFELLVERLEEFAIVLADTEGRFTSWHPGVRRIFGYEPPEFIGQPLDILFALADREMGVPRVELQTAIKNGVANDTRLLVRRDNTGVVVDGVTIALRKANGQLEGFGKVLRDVTQQKRVEDDLKALAGALDQSNVIVRRWDGVIEHWTAGCERLYGWTVAEAIGRVCHELLLTNFPIPRDTIQQQLLGAGSWRGEVEQKRRDGKLLSIAAQWALVRDEAGQPQRVIETQTDVTERSLMRRKLESANEELTRMANELERSNEELSEFARIASHDLGAPLTSAGWLVDLLTTRHGHQLDSDGLKYLTQIRSSLERMSDLMDGILAHARAGMSAIRTVTNADAEAAFAMALENLRRDIETSHASIEHHPLPPVPVETHALTQLFQNLLSNAIKYVHPGDRPVIRVTVREMESMWLFAVEDKGIGIDPGWSERIFLPMQRSHGTSVAGSGIGLTTCRKIVTRAGGRIWVESRPGEGATFFFTLPQSAPAPVSRIDDLPADVPAAD